MANKTPQEKLERRVLNNLSRRLDPRVLLGDKLEELKSEANDELAESFTKTVHDAEDHTGLTGVPAAEVFTEAAHATKDHTGLTGIPSVEGLLDEAAHDELDHTGLPGCGGEETFTQLVHDSEDHSSLPGVPSIEGLLDESAHDVLDHTGLTGCGGEETFTQLVHDSEDHSSLPGVPSVDGLLDENAHDALDHSGLPGISAPEGFTKIVHDASDHTGLEGIGNKSWKGVIDDGDELDVASDTTIKVANGWPTPTSTGGSSHYAVYPIPGQGEKSYSVQFIPDVNSGVFRVGFRAKVGSAPSNVWVGYTDVDVTGLADTIVTGVVELCDLQVGTDYYLVFEHITGYIGQSNINRVAKSGIEESRYYQVGFGWMHDVSYMPLFRVLGEFSYEDGDTFFSKGNRKLYSYNANTDTWDILNPDIDGLLDESTHDALDHSGLSGIPSIEGLLDVNSHRDIDHTELGLLSDNNHEALDHSGLIGIGDKSWKGAVVNVAALPGPVRKDADGCYPDMTMGMGFRDTLECAGKITGAGNTTYRITSLISWPVGTTADTHAIIRICPVLNGNPNLAAPIASSSPIRCPGAANDYHTIVTDIVADLVVGTTYWVVFDNDSAHNLNVGRVTGLSGKEVKYLNGAWDTRTDWAFSFKVEIGPFPVVDDTYIARATETLYRWDGDSWNVVGPNKAANQPASMETTYPTVTEFNALLDKLKAAGLMIVDS